MSELLPGSREAAVEGCTCPEMDNRGRPREWRIRSGLCPMHGAEVMAMIEASHVEHPPERCDLHRTPAGRCTCNHT